MVLNDRLLTSQKDILSNSLNLTNQDFYVRLEDEKTKNTIASLQAVPSSFRASPSHAHFDHPPFLRPAKQARGTMERGAELYSPCKKACGKLKEAVMGGQCLVFIRYHHKARVTDIGPCRLRKPNVCKQIISYDACSICQRCSEACLVTKRVMHYLYLVEAAPIFTERLKAGNWFGFAEAAEV